MKILDKLFKKNKEDKPHIRLIAKLDGIDEIKNQIDELEKRLKGLKVTISIGDEHVNNS